MRMSPKQRRAKEVEKAKREAARQKRERELEKKRYLCADMRARGMSYRDIAAEIGMSVGFVKKWCDRLEEPGSGYTRSRRAGKGAKRFIYRKCKGIRDAIKSLSTAPKNPRRKVTQAHIDAVREVRGGEFTKRMGAQKMKVYLGLDISAQTIHGIIVGLGIVKPKKRKQRDFLPFQRHSSNDLWQIDYKEFEPGVYMLSVKDDYSRMVLTAEVRATSTTDDVLEIMKRAVRLFGKPRQILSDHGTQWWPSQGDWCRFDEWCEKAGIQHIMGRVRHPQTQGKIERWHGSVLEEATLPPRGSPPEAYNEAIQRYVEYHNTRRPHFGICLMIPIDVYMGGLILNEVFTDLGVHEVS